jgi:hypothetical protein
MRALYLNSLLAAMLVIFFASGPTVRAAPAPSPSALLEQGVQSFNLGRFRRSMILLGRALRRATDTAVQAKIHLYLGMNHVVMRRQIRAEEAFKEALKRDPSLTLDPAQTKEAILSLFRQVRETLKGRLEIRADRSDALVTIDGTELGSAPYTGELTVGRHKVLVAAKELGQLFDPHEESILIHAGRTHTVEAKLKAHSGLLKLTSRPPGASVTVDGEERGHTPTSGVILPPGSHLVRLSLEGHQPRSEQVQVEAGVVHPLEVALEPLPPPKPPPVVVKEKKKVEQPKKAGTRRFWTWVVAGGAVAAAGAGLGFGLWARSDWEDYQNAAKAGDRARYDDLRDSGQSHATTANVFFITAGVLAATAAILYLFVERPPESSSRPTLGAWRW